MNQTIVQVASSQIGIKEIAGDEDNQTIVDYSKEIGIKWINDDETSWCAVFVNWVLKKAGYKYSASALARSFDSYGQATESPEPGDLVVFWRESKTSGKGHVGIFLGFSDSGSIFVLGGNQGNAVSISKYNKANLVGYRRAGESESLEIPKSPFGLNAKGDQVKKLQKLLIHFGYKLIADGIFGQNTKKILTDFQLDNHLTPSGSYDVFTEEKMFSLINE